MVAVNVNASHARIQANHNGANEQSGIKAGDGGFQVNVNGNTTLTGAVISSTDKAQQNNLNSYNATGSTTATDLTNTSNLNAQSASIGVSYGSGWSWTRLRFAGRGLACKPHPSSPLR